MMTIMLARIALVTSALLPLAAALPTAPSGQVPYTFFSLAYQDNLKINQARIGSKPYAKYFRPDLFVYPEMVDPGKTPIDCPTQALKPDFSDINKLLAPASTTLPNENAWCSYSTGQGYVSSRTHMPGVTADMITWWFWWHSAESERYSLWHPLAHISVKSDFVNRFNDPKLNNTEKLIGSTHSISEIILEPTMDIDIHWKRPSYFGLDESKFKANGIVASACGEINIPIGSPLKAVDMIHLWYQTSNGLELRSRYFLANNVRIDIPILGKILPINQIADALGIKNFIVGRSLSHFQFHHDQQEFTHLASILPALYKEYGNGAK